MGIGDAVMCTDSVVLVGRFPHHHHPPPLEVVAQMLKHVGKWMWRLECVIYVRGCGGVAGDATGLIEVLSWHLPEGVEENCEKPHSGWLVVWLKSKLSTSQIQA
jgi:hypothetical protein